MLPSSCPGTKAVRRHGKPNALQEQKEAGNQRDYHRSPEEGCDLMKIKMTSERVAPLIMASAIDPGPA